MKETKRGQNTAHQHRYYEIVQETKVHSNRGKLTEDDEVMKLFAVHSKIGAGAHS